MTVRAAPPLPASLQGIVDSIAADPSMDAHRLKAIVAGAGVTPDDLAPWADYDHPAADSYGRKMVYDGGSFEIMVMSWAPGDVSAIHDHGHAQWGAVQVFGPAEHAVFSSDGERLVTLNRARQTPGRVTAVTHDLVHQMGNPTDETFLTLHVYGNAGRTGDITADARVFDLAGGEIRTTDGGVFYNLPDELVNARTPAPAADFYTRQHDLVQSVRRARRAGADPAPLADRLADDSCWDELRDELTGLLDESGHVTDTRLWNWLFGVLKDTAALQRDLGAVTGDLSRDDWTTYAGYYDRVIGTTNSYIANYLKFVAETRGVDFASSSMIDVGCGTGWLETILTRDFGMDPARLLGVDPSPGMLSVAAGRCETKQGGLLDLSPDWLAPDHPRAFDVTFCNSYQYLPHEDFPRAVANMHAVTKPGGLCVSEFITTDHVRWYPNVILSEDDTVISLRRPALREKGGFAYQESEILNVNRLAGLQATYEGVHRRFIITPRGARGVIERAFGGPAEAFDAHTHAPIDPDQETCSSTRFVICARRAA